MSGPGVSDAVRELAAAGRRLVAAGAVVGSGGNLSARLDDGAHCLVSTAGAWLDELDDGHLCRVDIADGQVADPRTPSSELAVHLAAYRARGDTAAVVHAHPQHVLLLAAARRPVRLLTTDHVFYVGEVRTLPYQPPGGEAVAAALATALRDVSCVVLEAHGAVTVGPDVVTAVQRMLNLEQAAAMTVRALLLDSAEVAVADPPAALAALRSAPGV